MKFDFTEKAEVFIDEHEDSTKEMLWIRHVYRSTNGQRCTIFYPLMEMNDSQVQVLLDALNFSRKENSKREKQ